MKILQQDGLISGMISLFFNKSFSILDDRTIVSNLKHKNEYICLHNTYAIDKIANKYIYDVSQGSKSFESQYEINLLKRKSILTNLALKKEQKNNTNLKDKVPCFLIRTVHKHQTRQIITEKKVWNILFKSDFWVIPKYWI